MGQLPKRLFFRNRPWRKRKAIKLSSDQSSSFPSRSTFFALGAAYSLCLLYGVSFKHSLLCCAVVLMPIMHSRIFLGAHYFSDCIVGAFLVDYSQLGDPLQRFLLLHVPLGKHISHAGARHGPQVVGTAHQATWSSESCSAQTCWPAATRYTFGTSLRPCWEA